MSNQQLIWAMSHDWFSNSFNREVAGSPDGQMEFIVVVLDRTEFQSYEFTSFEALKAWAGY
jgi:hypothetical protein